MIRTCLAAFLLCLGWLPAESTDVTQRPVSLRNVTLSMDELAREASSQTGVLIELDVNERGGLRILYDCESSLREILDGIAGYYRTATGYPLEEIWKGKEKVTLKLIKARAEITAVQAEGDSATVKVKEDPKPKTKRQPFWKELLGRDGGGTSSWFKKKKKESEGKAAAKPEAMDTSTPAEPTPSQADTPSAPEEEPPTEAKAPVADLPDLTMATDEKENTAEAPSMEDGIDGSTNLDSTTLKVELVPMELDMGPTLAEEAEPEPAPEPEEKPMPKEPMKDEPLHLGLPDL